MKTYTVELVVAQEDIDESVGHAGYGAYARYYKAGADGLLMEIIGADHGSMRDRYGVNCSAVDSHIRHPAELLEGDRITVYTDIESLGKASITYKQHIEKESTTVSTAVIVTAFNTKENLKRKAVRMPPEIREKLIAAFPHLGDPE